MNFEEHQVASTNYNFLWTNVMAFLQNGMTQSHLFPLNFQTSTTTSNEQCRVVGSNSDYSTCETIISYTTFCSTSRLCFLLISFNQLNVFFSSFNSTLINFMSLQVVKLGELQPFRRCFYSIIKSIFHRSFYIVKLFYVENMKFVWLVLRYVW